MKFKITLFGTIEDIQNREDLSLATDLQDTEFIKEYLGNHEDIEDFDGFFVNVKDGEYTEIYGFEGSVPYLYKSLWKIEIE